MLCKKLHDCHMSESTAENYTLHFFCFAFDGRIISSASVMELKLQAQILQLYKYIYKIISQFSGRSALNIYLKIAMVNFQSDVVCYSASRHIQCKLRWMRGGKKI